MKIIRAPKAGFCMGVALALRKLDESLLAAGLSGRVAGRVATLGAIIHNPQVLEDYARQGVLRLESPEQAEADMTVLIRAHGVSRQDEAVLRGLGVNLVDATCPRVKEAQLSIASATSSETEGGGEGEAELLLYGEALHPEVRGLISYAAGAYHIFSSREELEALRPQLDQNRRYVLAAQTTQDRPLFEALRKELELAMDKRLTVLDTICDATRQRQEETIRLAAEVQAMVVVGGFESGNTRRLAAIAAEQVPTLHVETELDLDPDFFRQAEIVGLTAGASTPRQTIDLVEEHLRKL